MKKITLKMSGKSVSASFPEEESLDEVLQTVSGLIKALGYCFDGVLEIVPNDTEN